MEITINHREVEAPGKINEIFELWKSTTSVTDEKLINEIFELWKNDSIHLIVNVIDYYAIINN